MEEDSGLENAIILTKVKDLEVGGLAYVPSPVLLADSYRSLYVCFEMYGTIEPSDGRPITIFRTGEGLGEFQFEYEGKLEIPSYKDPMYAIPLLYTHMAEQADDAIFAPYGFGGGMKELYKTFYPGDYDDWLEANSSYEQFVKSSKAIPKSKVQTVDLKEQYPQTYQYRYHLKQAMKAGADSKTILDLVNKINENPIEKLTTREAINAFRIDPSL